MDQMKLFSPFLRPCLASFWDVSHGIFKVHNLGPHLWATPIWATQVRKVYILAHLYGPYKKAFPTPTMTPRMPPLNSSPKLHYPFNFVSIKQNLSSSLTCYLLWLFLFFITANKWDCLSSRENRIYKYFCWDFLAFHLAFRVNLLIIKLF